MLVGACGRMGFDLQTARTGDADVADGTDGAPDAMPFVERVQTSNPMFVNGGSISATLSLTADHTVLAVAYWNDSGHTISVADTSGATWTALPRQSVPTGCSNNLGANTQIFYATIAATGSSTITATQSVATSPLGMFVAEYAGLRAANVIDASGGNAATVAGNAMSAGTLQSTGTGVIVAVFHDSQSSGTMVPGPGMAVMELDTLSYALLGEVPVTAGSYTVSASLPAGRMDACWVASAVALRAR